WTPAWTIFSGGACFLLLAGFTWIIEVKGPRRWAFPLVVIGMNSIAAYLMAHLFERFLIDSFNIHLGLYVLPVLGGIFTPFFRAVAVLCAYWLMLWWMYRRKIFLRI
ncbi:MAG TPA: hypothetical protein VHB50_16820, partial [Bryobacteraceae bacterium]|nr:hypothetical protein [Bryobacteraceae bacterium]